MHSVDLSPPGYDRQFPKEMALKVFRSKALESAIKRISPDLWRKSTDELEMLFNPTTNEVCIKLNYWQHFSSSFPNGKRKNLSVIYDDVCTYTNFYNHFLGQPHKVAWLLKSHHRLDYIVSIYQFNILEKIRAAAELPIIDPDGNILPRQANFLLKMLKTLDPYRK